MDQVYREPSLCWKCKNAVSDDKYGCSWSRACGYEPVEGAVMDGNRVLSCPEFIDDKEEKK